MKIKNKKFLVTRTTVVEVIVEEASSLKKAKEQALSAVHLFLDFSHEDNEERLENVHEGLHFPQMKSEATGYLDRFEVSEM